jgi:hypothetical protein
MAGVWHSFQACGWASWLCLLCSLVAVPVALVALMLALLRARAATVLSLVAFALSFLPFLVGVLGQQLGRARVDKVLEMPSIDPSARERIRVEGHLEADQCLAVGGALSGFPALLAAGAILAALSLRRRENG